MPWVMQMLGCAVTLLGLALVVWLGFWVIIAVAVLAAFGWVWRVLAARGIVNPIPGVSPGQMEEGEAMPTIIEGEFKKVETELTEPKKDYTRVDSE